MASSQETRLFINNEFVAAKHKERLTLINPFDESTVTSDVHTAGPEDVDAAVSAATTALKGDYGKLTGAQRGALMNKLADLIEKNAEALAKAESIPTGRPVSMIQNFDLPHLAATYRYYAGWADKLPGRHIPADNGSYRVVRYEPVGIAAGIASWNATFLYIGWKIAPALAAGCTFIFKASEKSPLGALAIAPLFAEAGFPPGTVNFISGSRLTGELLASHPRIHKISFTGSINAGKAVQQAATKSNLKRVTLELGGKSAAIVFNDADLSVAIPNVGPGFLANSGQICAASSRVLVQEDIAPKLIAALKDIFAQSAAALDGSPQDPATQLGPLVDKLQFERVMSFISSDDAKASELVVGGKRHTERGYGVDPTIYLNPAEDSKLWKDEIFGPVLSIRTFKTEAEAIALANDSDYGLAATVYTNDVTRALRVSSKLETGSVSVNAMFMPDVQMPFGGWKQSGVGRELGEDGVRAYLEAKSVFVNMNVPERAE
jgi:aldehyde dehydrogenase (NAD+)